jgi:predicted permease
MDTLRQDIRYAFRQIARTPAFTAIAVLLLALGIGANAAIFTVLYSIEGRPAPGIPDTDGLVRIIPTFQRNGETRPLYGGTARQDEFLVYRAQRETFSDVAAYARTQNVEVDVGHGPTAGKAILTSSGYFSTLRVPMTLGSGFAASNDSLRDASPVAVISRRFWSRHLDAAPDVVGRRITVNDLPVTIIGVAGDRFVGMEYELAGDLWLPLPMYSMLFPGASLPLAPGAFMRMQSHPDSLRVNIVARLRRGVPEARADAIVGTLGSRLAAGNPRVDGVTVYSARIGVPSSGGANSDMSGPIIFATFAAFGLFILLVTCTNVSNLLIGRAMGRQHEIGVRLSVGASRGRVIRQLLTESTVLAMLGAGFGTLLFYWLVEAVGPLAGDSLPDVAPNWVTLAVTAAVALGTGVVFGLLPALHATRTDVSHSLRKGLAPTSRRTRLQSGFVIAQLVLTVPVLAIAAAMVGFIVSGVFRSPGYESSANVGYVTINVDATNSPPEYANRLARQAAAIIAGTPGVEGVSIASAPPNGYPDRNDWIARDGTRLPPKGFRRPDDRGGVLENGVFERYVMYVGPDYFPTMGIPLRRGRAIDATHVAGSEYVAVVSEDFAQRVWPGLDPIGRTLVRGATLDTTFTVIGIAGATRSFDGAAPTVYLAHSQRADSVVDSRSATSSARGEPGYSMTVYLVMRSSGPVDALAPAVRGVVNQLDPTARALVRSTADRRALDIQMARQVASVALACGAFLLLLSSIGLYTVIAFGVARRTREIGIRMALGARTRQVIGVFVRQGMTLGMVGLCAGLPIGIAAALNVPDIGDTPTTLISIVVMTLILLAVAGAASWIPARRAAAVDPTIALRSE